MIKSEQYWECHHDSTLELFKKRPLWMKHYDNDYPSAIFIRGLISEYKPENLLEIGTAAGWAAYYMLEEALKHNNHAKLVSLDNIEFVYYNEEKKIGSAFQEVEPDLYKKWELITSKISIDFLNNSDKKFDFVFIDASHVHPWATLDFISVLPFLNENAIVVFHDVFLNKIREGKMPADRHPDGTVTGEKNVSRGPNVLYNLLKKEMTLSYDTIAPNCSALIVNSSKKEYILKKLAVSLGKNWEYSHISYPYLRDIAKKYLPFIEKHFGFEMYKLFKSAFEKQLFFARLRYEFRKNKKRMELFSSMYFDF